MQRLTAHINTKLQKAAAAAALKVAKQFKDLDEDLFAMDVESILVLQERVLSVQTDALKSVVAVGCPFYVSPTLASFARQAEEMPQVGLTMLAGLVEYQDNTIGWLGADRQSTFVYRNKPAEEWAQWTRGASSAMSRSRSSSIAVTETGLERMPYREEAVDCWWNTITPALRHSARFLNDAKITKAVAQLRDELLHTLRECVDDAQQVVAAQFHSVISPEHLALVASTGRTIGTYNFLFQKPAGGLDPATVLKYRTQSLQSLGNLRSLLVDFSNPQPQSFENQLRGIIDQGGRVHDWVAEKLGTRSAIIKAFANAKFSPADSARATDYGLLSDYIELMTVLPAQRAPKSAEELEIAMSLSHVIHESKELATIMAIEPSTLWEGALKNGWGGLVKEFSAMRLVDEKPHPPSLPVAGAILDEGLTAGKRLLETLEVIRRGNPEIFGPHLQREDRTIARLLLQGKSLRGVVELGAKLRDALSAARATINPELKSDREYEWTPLLKGNGRVMIGEAIVQELVQRKELDIEGAQMGHCVGWNNYDHTCLNYGSRIISFRLHPEATPTERATLEIRFDAGDTELGLRRIQFHSLNNSLASPALEDVYREFIRRLKNDEISWDRMAYAKDVAAQYRVKSTFVDEYTQASAHLDQGLGFLLPKNYRQASLKAYLHSDEFKALAEALDQAETAPEPAL